MEVLPKEGRVKRNFAIKPMHPERTAPTGLWRAIQADTLSLTAFDEVGLCEWMTLTWHYLFRSPLETDLITYGFVRG